MSSLLPNNSWPAGTGTFPMSVFLSSFCKFCFDPICVNVVPCMLFCFLASSCHCILLHFIVLARICAAAPFVTCLRVYVFIVLVFIIVFCLQLCKILCIEMFKDFPSVSCDSIKMCCLNLMMKVKITLVLQLWKSFHILPCFHISFGISNLLLSMKFGLNKMRWIPFSNTTKKAKWKSVR